MKKNNELSYYNQNEVWNGYNNLHERRRAKEVIDLIPNEITTVLDIGCGNGIITNMINKSYVVGLDFAIIPLIQVKTNTIRASINKLPIKKGKFELIILTEVLEHLDNNNYSEAIEQIKMLKGRYLLITVPYKENMACGLSKCSACGNLFKPSHHYRIFDDFSIFKEFSEYNQEKIKFSSKNGIIQNEKLYKFGYKFGVYIYSDFLVCNKCGNRPIHPNRIFKYIFDGLNFFDHVIKRILRIQKPAYLIILLKRKKS